MTIEQRLITYPDIGIMLDELESYTYNVSDLGNVRFSAPDGLHDDCVISLALAVSGMKNFIYGKVNKAKRTIRYPKNSNVENMGIGY